MKNAWERYQHVCEILKKFSLNLNIILDVTHPAFHI